MVTVYVALGSNLDNPVQQLQRALKGLAQLPQSCLCGHSRLYRSAPLAGMEQPDYINAVAQLETTLAPLELLDALQQLELAQGRLRHERWGARTLDLDLLLYGDHVIQSERLTVPHYAMTERPFVLYPLSELAPELQLPDGQHLAALLARVSSAGLEPVAEG